MNIILLHGEDERRSYERLQKFIDSAKGRSWEVVSLDDSTLSFTETLLSSPLFPGERFFILKDVRKLGKRETEWLEQKNEDIQGNLVIYHGALASTTLIKSLPKNVKIEEFKLPKLVFEFLESVRPGNQKRAIELLHEAAKKDAPEFTFSLLARHIRDLYWVSVDMGSIPYPNWRVGKLKGQAQRFSTGRLLELLNNLSELDIRAKTSATEIIPSLDVLLATKLE